MIVGNLTIWKGVDFYNSRHYVGMHGKIQNGCFMGKGVISCNVS